MTSILLRFFKKRSSIQGTKNNQRIEERMSYSFTKSRLDPANDKNIRRGNDPNVIIERFAPPPEYGDQRIKRIARGSWTYIDSNPIYVRRLLKRFKRIGIGFLILENIISLLLLLPAKFFLSRHVLHVLLLLFSSNTSQNSSNNIQEPSSNVHDWNVNNRKEWEGVPFASFKNLNPFLVSTTPEPDDQNMNGQDMVDPSYHGAIYLVIGIVEIVHVLSTFFAISALYEESRRKSIGFSLFSLSTFFLTALLTGFFAVGLVPIAESKLVATTTIGLSLWDWLLIGWTLSVTFSLFIFFLYFCSLVKFIESNAVLTPVIQESTTEAMLKDNPSNVYLRPDSPHPSTRSNNNNNLESTNGEEEKEGNGINWKMFSLKPPSKDGQERERWKEEEGERIFWRSTPRAPTRRFFPVLRLLLQG